METEMLATRLSNPEDRAQFIEKLLSDSGVPFADEFSEIRRKQQDVDDKMAEAGIDYAVLPRISMGCKYNGMDRGYQQTVGLLFYGLCCHHTKCGQSIFFSKPYRVIVTKRRKCSH